MNTTQALQLDRFLSCNIPSLTFTCISVTKEHYLVEPFILMVW